MFCELTKMLNDYASAYDEAREKRDKKYAYIDKEYSKDGSLWVEKRREVKENFENSVATLREQYTNITEVVLKNARQKLDNMVTVKVDTGIVAQIGFLRTLNLTQSEFDVYVKKYSDNFFVMKALKEVGQEKHLHVDKISTLDDYIKVIDVAKEDCRILLSTYTGRHNYYICDVILKGRMFDDYDRQFKVVWNTVES